MTNAQTSTLNSPCGGRLVELRVESEESEVLRRHASSLDSIQLTERSACDLELLAVGPFRRWTGMSASPITSEFSKKCAW